MDELNIMTQEVLEVLDVLVLIIPPTINDQYSIYSVLLVVIRT